MLESLKKTANYTYTENGALTHRTTESDCLDLFAAIGALRSEDESRIVRLFLRAYAENADLAVKTLFYARDVRAGLGERRIFRILLKYLAKMNKESVLKNLSYVQEFGRFDDLLVLLGTPCEEEMIKLIKTQMDADLQALAEHQEISLLAKWLPSVNASNREAVQAAKRLASLLGMKEREYRKKLSALREALRLTENHLRKEDYTFDYEKQPSKAMFKYRSAFLKNDHERYVNYMEEVRNGKTKLNAKNVLPYEIIRTIMSNVYVDDDCSVLDFSDEERKIADITWKALPDYTGDTNALVVADVSGSMFSAYGGSVEPIEVSVSLAIYFAERCRGKFNNHFITFSETPNLVEIKGKDITEKLLYCCTCDWGMNTDLSKVFELILNTAVENHLPQEELPSTLYIISDMEFDSCMYRADMTNFKYAKKIFEEHGYKLPQVVFWNVCSRNNQFPVKKDERGVALVSGCTPSIFAQVMPNGEEPLTPFEQMMEILGSERYEKISA